LLGVIRLGVFVRFVVGVPASLVCVSAMLALGLFVIAVLGCVRFGVLIGFIC